MKPLIVTMLCVGFLSAGVARADLEPGTIAPEVNAKEWLNVSEWGNDVSLTELRGMVVVLFFWVSFHGGGQATMDFMNIVYANPRLGRDQGVFVMGLTDATKEQVQAALDKEKVFFPVGVESDAAKEYRIGSFPRMVIIDAEGKVAWSGSPGEGGGDALVKNVLDTVAKTPPRKTHPLNAIKAREAIEEAKKAIRGEDYREALKAAKTAFQKALAGDTLKTQTQDLLDLLDAIGRDKLAQAEKFVDENKYDQGIALLREVMRQFRGSDAGKAAKTRLEALSKQHEQVKRVLEEQKSEAEGRSELADAIDSIKKREFGEAYDLLEQIVASHPNGDAAKDAQKIINRMNKNDAVMGYVRDFKAKKDASSLISQARSFIKTNNIKKARELLQAVIEKYPDTTYSDEAFDELRKL